LNWLLSENYFANQHNKLFRTAQEKAEMELMRHPISSQKSYSILGLALGTFPPAAIFTKLLGNNIWLGRIEEEAFIILLLLFAMNLVCALAGYGMGSVLGKSAFELERSSWTKMLLTIPFLALAWGIVTGAAGGLVFFGFGALVAPFFAVPTALVAFPAFAFFHRLLERGGMIDRKHLLPLAFGISLTISAFILGI
jgi:hypothetical protein